MTLTAEQVAVLRAPFAADAIKVKPQTVTKDQTNPKGLVTFYIDARLVVDRLDEAVGAENWTDEYRLLCEGIHAPSVGIPIECSLTVNGVTKVDVGQIAPGEKDDKMWKSAYSDAFKRAAVKFGVGAYLYDGPSVWCPVKIGNNGKAQGFTDEGKQQAFAAYRKWIGSGAPTSQGTPVAAPVAAKPLEGPAATPVQQKKLDRLVANLSNADASKDWNAIVEKYAVREFQHSRSELGTVEIEQAIGEFTAHLESLQVPA